MAEQHPITPSLQLRQLWAQQAQRMDPHDPVAWLQHVATQAARWGADIELEECVYWLSFYSSTSDARQLRTARRPKSPSLTEQALSALYAITSGADDTREFYQDIETIKIALGRLQELEKLSDDQG